MVQLNDCDNHIRYKIVLIKKFAIIKVNVVRDVIKND